MGASEQQVLIVHQGSSLSISQAGSHLFANRFKASMKQLDDVEPIYHKMGMRQNLVDGIMVTGPHVCANYLNLFAYEMRQALQIPDHVFFSAISKQVNDLMVLDICDHTPILMQQVQLVDAQTTYAGLCKARLKVSGRFAEQKADRSFCQASLISKTGEGFAQCSRLQVADQAAGHEVVLIHVGHGFKKASVTATTAVSFAMKDNSNVLVSDGLIHEDLLLHFVLVDLGVSTMSTTRGRSAALRLNVEVVFILIYRKDTVLSQSQDVQISLSPKKELPHKFSGEKENPVSKRWSFPTGFRQISHTSQVRRDDGSLSDSPHFYDVALVCTGVKNNEIPRTFTNIQDLCLRSETYDAAWRNDSLVLQWRDQRLQR